MVLEDVEVEVLDTADVVVGLERVSLSSPPNLLTRSSSESTVMIVESTMGALGT